jgi:hypothetical protein
MNIPIYVLSFAVILNFFVTSIAIVRVARWRKDLSGLDWEAVATLLGDVATVKRSITRLNGRLNGMDSPKYDVEQEIAKAMANSAKPVQRGG